MSDSSDTTTSDEPVQVVLHFVNFGKKPGETVSLPRSEADRWIARRLASPIPDTPSEE